MSNFRVPLIVVIALFIVASLFPMHVWLDPLIDSGARVVAAVGSLFVVQPSISE